VATEHFFEQPLIMEKNAPELYRRLREYYGQDPASRFRQNNCAV
jgi:Mlc titration factor MtfA (ptsG expression regulator)